MIKLFSILVLTLLTGFYRFKEPVKIIGGAYEAILLTIKTNSKSTRGSERSTIRIVYTCNKAGDSINVYTVDEGAVSAPTAYSIGTKGGFYLIAKPIYSTDAPDSIRIGFSETDHTILINKNDRYQLYPAYYAWFKQEVQTKHSVIAILRLLEDNIGEYPITDALPLLLYPSQSAGDKHILQAKVVTSRSQADEITDTWNCTYHYNKNGKLDMVKASSGNEIRFRKQISYRGANAIAAKSYRNIEDRQTTDRAVAYPMTNTLPLKWNDHILETGKNLETDLAVTLTKKELGRVKAITMSQAEVLNLIKQTGLNGNGK